MIVIDYKAGDERSNLALDCLLETTSNFFTNEKAECR